MRRVVSSGRVVEFLCILYIFENKHHATLANVQNMKDRVQRAMFPYTISIARLEKELLTYATHSMSFPRIDETKPTEIKGGSKGCWNRSQWNRPRRKPTAAVY
jgi:hypothetical protein